MAAPKATKHVLVVEDDSAIRQLLEDVLLESGYTVALALNGRDALAEIRRRVPDLVLLDLMLPDMDGWSFLKACEGDRKLLSIPILVISAAAPAGVHEAQKLGAPLFLRKPFDISQLLCEVERLCGGHVRQCAWCGRVVDEAGRFRLHSGRKLRWASHGICPVCKQVERNQVLNWR
jgi:CheY-like chemotaxis protein